MKRPPAKRSTGDEARPAGDAGDDPEGPRSPLRVMHIIELLAGANSGLSLAAMTEALHIPKTSLLNHLRVLVRAGYADLRDGRYTLGPSAMRLGVVIAADVGVLTAARPVAADLAAKSGETAMCATLDERLSEAVCIDVVDGMHDIRYSPRVGSRWPLYSTGMGRALLAFQDAATIDQYLERADVTARTATTITDRSRLHRLLEDVRARGVAVTEGEHTPGAGAVAAPVIERDGRVRHVVGLGVPVERLRPRREQLVRLVVEAARQVSWTLGGRSTIPPPLAATARPPHNRRTGGTASSRRREG